MTLYWRDLGRYIVASLFFTALDVAAFYALGWHMSPDANKIMAGFVVIISAIREERR